MRKRIFLTMRNIDFVCKTFFNVEASDQFNLSDFSVSEK